MKNTKPYIIGKNYLIRTVTYHFTGKLIYVGTNELVLINTAWIADSGRFTQALQNENFDEVEMYPKNSEVIIGRNSIIDATIIKNLPKQQK